MSAPRSAPLPVRAKLEKLRAGLGVARARYRGLLDSTAIGGVLQDMETLLVEIVNQLEVQRGR